MVLCRIASNSEKEECSIFLFRQLPLSSGDPPFNFQAHLRHLGERGSQKLFALPGNAALILGTI